LLAASLLCCGKSGPEADGVLKRELRLSSAVLVMICKTENENERSYGAGNLTKRKLNYVVEYHKISYAKY